MNELLVITVHDIEGVSVTPCAWLPHGGRSSLVNYQTGCSECP